MDKLNLRELILIIIIGGLSGLIVFKLAQNGTINSLTQTRVVVSEENAVISAVEKVSPSVVAIGVTQQIINPFNPFSPSQAQNSTIGTGFVVSDKGIIVTNRHVVSDLSATYSVVTKDGQNLTFPKFTVTRLWI